MSRLEDKYVLILRSLADKVLRLKNYPYEVKYETITNNRLRFFGNDARGRINLLYNELMNFQSKLGSEFLHVIKNNSNGFITVTACIKEDADLEAVIGGLALLNALDLSIKSLLME